MTEEVIDAVARSKIESHEEVCAARYIELTTALASLNNRMFLSAGAIIMALLGVLATILTRH